MNIIGKTTVLSLALVAALLVVAVPGIDAEDATYQDITAEDFLALAEDGVISLDADYALTTALTVSSQVVIDLNGHNIVNAQTNTNHTINVAEGGSLTVTGTGTIDNVTHGTVAIMNDGTVVLNGGTVTRSAEASGNTYYVILNNGTMTISENATVSKAAPSQMSSMIDNAGTLTVNGGTFDAGLDIVLKNEETGTVEIHDGSFVNSNARAYSVQNWGTMTIDGGTFAGIVMGLTEPGSPASLITITDGTFAAQVYAWNYAPVASPSENAPHIVIDGGEFNSATAINTYVGGTDTSGDNRTVTLDSEIASIVVNGGTFVRTPAPYLASDVLCLVNNGTYSVTDDVSSAVASTGNMYWTSLADALRSANGAQVVLVDDVSLDAYILVNKDNVSLDLNGHTVLGDLDSELIDSYNKNFTISDSANGGMILNLGDGPAIDGQKIVVTGGVFSSDVTSFLADGMACYEYAGYHIVVADTDSPSMIIAGIPFASVGDALTLINIAGDFATVDGDVLTLTANIPDTGDVAMTIPASSGLTIDLNGHDMAIGVVTLAGALNITDSVGEGTLTASGIVVTGGSVAGSGTIAATSGTVNLISIIGSGSVCGVTVDISDVTSNGGAVNIETGLTGTATIDGVTIVIDGADAVADRGIYVNQMPDTGSAVIRNVTFAFSGNDACPLNADVDGSTDLTIDRLKFVDCARTNKVLLNSIEDVTIGSEGNIRISGTTDIVLWDSSSTGKTFTVAGDLIVSGRMAVTFDGNLIVPETGSMTVNGSLEIHTDGTVEGTIHFGSDMTDSILLSDVVAGEDGLTLSLGSVVMSGSVASGSMTVNGTGRVDGNLDLGASTLTITSGSTFNVNRSSEVSGTSGLLVEGKMNVYGTVSAPVTNNGELYTIGSGAVTGAVTGDEPQEKEDEPLSIEFIPDMNWTIGEERSISIGVHPIDATITGLTGADWLTFTGNVISGTPTEAGTYTITLTVGVDNGNGMETVQDTFVITVAEAPVDDGQDDDGDGFDWRIIAIVILIVVIAILVLRNFIG